MSLGSDELEGFPDVEQFINTYCDRAPATIGKLKQILNNPVKELQLKLELAVVIDAGEAFVKATYKLEGDGPLALSAYEEIGNLYTVIAAPHFPNTKVVSRQACNGNQSNEQHLLLLLRCLYNLDLNTLRASSTMNSVQ